MTRIISIVKIQVNVPVGMGLLPALEQAKKLAWQYQCAVEIEDFNGKNYTITSSSDPVQIWKDYCNLNKDKLGL